MKKDSGAGEKFEAWHDNEAVLNIRQIKDGVPLKAADITKIYSRHHMTINQVMKVYGFMQENDENYASVERQRTNVNNHHISPDDNMQMQCGNQQKLLSELPEYENQDVRSAITKVLGASEKWCEKADRKSDKEAEKNAKLDKVYDKIRTALQKVRDKLPLIQNHGHYAYESVNLNNVEEIKKKFGHKPFELSGMCDDYKSGSNWTSWKETRPVYRLNSDDEVVLLGGAVYSVSKAYDEYENHPAKYSFRGFITPAQYKKKVANEKANQNQPHISKSGGRDGDL